VRFLLEALYNVDMRILFALFFVAVSPSVSAFSPGLFQRQYPIGSRSSSYIYKPRSNVQSKHVPSLRRRRSTTAKQHTEWMRLHQGGIQEDDVCEMGVNAVDECKSLPATQSKISAVTNVAKCICGAGSFALPHVFLEEGILGGTLAITLCGGLAAYTMQSLANSKAEACELGSGVTILSYVELAEKALGRPASQIVFFLTMSASIGVCSTYLVFIGQTLESLSFDATSANVIRQTFPDVPTATWEAAAALVLYPLSLLRSYGIFAFTSALGVVAVLGGIFVTLASGILVEPGGGIGTALSAIGNCPMWPESLASAFGGSFGTLAYLFCVNFLTFPIINSMEEPKEYGGAVGWAVAGVWFVNVIFAILCLGFYGYETQDLVLGNLNNGPYLSALKILLCVDLIFTFPIVFSSGRQILENAILGPEAAQSDESAVARAAIVAVAVSACFGLAQIGGFGAVANLVGGVAQGTLAFIIPPAIAVSLARRNGTNTDLAGGEAGQFLLGAFGVAVVSSVTYFTAVGILQ
jgi:proton-coupled amino acid transporter